MDVWMKQDIANALLASLQAMKSTIEALNIDPQRARDYESGYLAALRVIARFFGVTLNGFM